MGPSESLRVSAEGRFRDGVRATQDMIVGANAATATALEAIASEPEPASVDWKSGQIDIPVEVIPMDDDERDRKRGKKKRARKRDESPPPSKRQAVGGKQRPKRRSPSPVPPQDDEVETEAQKKERCARGVPSTRLVSRTALMEMLRAGWSARSGNENKRRCRSGSSRAPRT